MANFDVELNDEVENFTVEFGEIQRITVDDFDKLRNRPSYAGQTMTHETNIPEVPTAVSQLTNDADYQTGSEVESAISTAVGDEKDAREQADDGLSRDIGVVDGKVDAEADARERADIALQGAIDDEETARKNADNGLQGQIDAITSSSDVVDIVGTYAELLQYPTAGLGDKDVIKVLQDETHNDAMSYYRWNKSSSTWSYIGSEGPYYTKSETNTLLGDKQDTLTAGSNITISSNNTISATDTTYTAGNGLTLTGTEFSADTTVLQPKLTAGDGINISAQNVISADIDPADFFTASETVDGTGSEMTLNNTIQAKIKSVQMDGDTYQQTYSGKNLFNISAVTSLYTYQSNYSINNNQITITSTASSGTSYALIKPLYTFKKNTTYTVSFKYTGNLNRIVMLTSNSVTYGEASTTNTLTFTTSDSADTMNLGIYPTLGNSITVYDIQFEEGNQATSYEPFTGSTPTQITPAPNPDYPQPIQVVTGTQNVWVHGKNMLHGMSTTTATNYGVTHTWDNNTVTLSGSASGAYSNVTQNNFGTIPAGTYTFSTPTPSGVFNTNLRVRYDGTNYNYTIPKNGTSVTFTIPKEASTFLIYIDGLTAGTQVSGVYSYMLERNSTVTTYEPYQGANYTIDLGATELCKIGTYQDKVYKSNGDWYVHKETGKVVLDGTESWSNGGNWWGSGRANYGMYCYFTDLAKIGVETTYNHALICNDFSEAQTGLSLRSGVTEGIKQNGGTGQQYIALAVAQTRLADVTSQALTLSSLKNWLSTNKPIVYHTLDTPTNTKITDATLISELNALADALGYKDKTIITVSATGTNLPAILEVSAYRNSLAGVLGVIGRAEAA